METAHQRGILDSRRPLAAHPVYPPTLGARYVEEAVCRFRVWAPAAQSVELRLLTLDERLFPMEPRDHGYFEATVRGVPGASRYFFRLNGQRDRPDPASFSQPDGVHEASAVVDHAYVWHDRSWSGIPLDSYIIYELHVGTFTEEGTFDAAIRYLDELKAIGISAVELMPVAQFPGGRNWGYDGVGLFAAQNTYGGPQGLKRLVDACHERELAVVLDVVYNHIGPEGNYLREFGHYFTDRYHTPWGQALNFDGRHSDEVRRFFIENALYWIADFHIDALRLDAVHAIQDISARPFLRELADAVRLEGERLNRRVYTIAESNLNDTRLLQPGDQGGCGIDAQWCDDLHHAIRVSLTGDRSGYYEDFHGFDDLAKAYRDGFVYDGRSSVYRGRRHGNAAQHISPGRFVVCSQNHDQVGNRLLGERLADVCSYEQLKLAASLVILSPYLPMLFMGEEYGETSPFQFFTSHTDPVLVEAVRRGRKEEFASFGWSEEPPDPQAEQTFQRCKLNHQLKEQPKHKTLMDFYGELISLRRSHSALAFVDRERIDVQAFGPARLIMIHRWSAEGDVVALFNPVDSQTTLSLPVPSGRWTKRIDSADVRWSGPGSTLPDTIESAGNVPVSLAPHSAVVFIA